MCTKSFFRRFGAFVAALVLCFALSVPALADTVVNGTACFDYSLYSGSWSSRELEFFSSGTGRNFELFSSDSASRAGWYRYYPKSSGPSQILDTYAEGTYGIYISCFYASNAGAKQNHVPSRSDFSLVYTSSNIGFPSSNPVQSVRLFAPSSSYSSLSDGVTVMARFTQSKSDLILSWYVYNGSDNLPSWTFDSISGNFTQSVYLCVTNAQVVLASSNAELDSLENIASEISMQSQILSQFYGSIVAVCNQIYQRLGDLQAAQEECNRLFSNVISLLNTTNGKIEAINMAMSTYFELLLNQLMQEGIDIRTAIADAEARLELYLKPMIDYFNELEEQTGESASSLPQHKQDIEGFNNDGFGIVSDGQTGLTAILPIFTAFSFILSVLGIFVGLGVLKIIIKKGLS